MTVPTLEMLQQAEMTLETMIPGSGKIHDRNTHLYAIRIAIQKYDKGGNWPAVIERTYDSAQAYIISQIRSR